MFVLFLFIVVLHTKIFPLLHAALLEIVGYKKNSQHNYILRKLSLRE
jgi:hypothetical protein